MAQWRSPQYASECSDTFMFAYDDLYLSDQFLMAVISKLLMCMPTAYPILF